MKLKDEIKKELNGAKEEMVKDAIRQILKDEEEKLYEIEELKLSINEKGNILKMLEKGEYKFNPKTNEITVTVGSKQYIFENKNKSSGGAVALSISSTDLSGAVRIYGD